MTVIDDYSYPLGWWLNAQIIPGYTFWLPLS